jgi:hypothetical protein
LHIFSTLKTKALDCGGKEDRKEVWREMERLPVAMAQKTA